MILGRKREVAKFGRGNGVRSIWVLRAEREGIRCEEALYGIGNQFTVVGLRTAELMMPMFAGGKLPFQIGAEEAIVRVGVEIGRFEQRLARSLRIAGVIAQR